MPSISYIICGTPRSGSTLLCEMLAATGTAGRPNSYFRPEDITTWADEWGVDHSSGTETAEFDRSYLAAMRRAGSAGTSVFGLRLMWNGVAEARRRLGRALGPDHSLVALLNTAFGPPVFLHLSRIDKVAQAISLIKAEQSGVWHMGTDGTVLEGTATPAATAYDEDRLKVVLDELETDDASWNGFFAEHAIQPLRLTYEALAEDPRKVLGLVLSALGQDSSASSAVEIRTAKMADATNREWARRFAARPVG